MCCFWRIKLILHCQMNGYLLTEYSNYNLMQWKHHLFGEKARTNTVMLKQPKCQQNKTIEKLKGVILPNVQIKTLNDLNAFSIIFHANWKTNTKNKLSFGLFQQSLLDIFPTFKSDIRCSYIFQIAPRKNKNKKLSSWLF